MIRKSLCLALLLASILPSASFAGSKQRTAHARDFYARVPEEPETISLPQHETTTHHGGDCFRALTPVEMTRGIRHWTGAC
ncbi:MAG: hypothetical protein ACR652_02050 [Methylocystis sp.]|uniref:hypothetical protein n=1 Tax=Methylocystis sp. TaxID=1911079 RepID=UPI003DA1D610